VRDAARVRTASDPGDHIHTNEGPAMQQWQMPLILVYNNHQPVSAAIEVSHEEQFFRLKLVGF